METTTPSQPDIKKDKSTRALRIPNKQVDLKNLGLRVNLAWKSSGLTLLWKTSEQFAEDINMMETSIENKDSTASIRKTKSKEAKNLNAAIDIAVKRVKDYLVFKYTDKGAVSHYAQWGIKKLGSGYRFPGDRDARIESFKLMVASMVANTPPIEGYGVDFWKDAQTRFIALNTELSGHAGSISGNVKHKDNAMVTVRKVLNSIIKLVEANYPEDSEKVLREWGFLREKN